MLFKDGPRGRMAKDWPSVHPELRQLLEEFDAFSRQAKLPEVVVTELVRDVPQQVRLYVAHFKRLQQALKPGPRHGRIDPEGDNTWRPLTNVEWVEARLVEGMSEALLVARASRRFTWHWARCAVDLRCRHYSRAQLAQVREFFEARCRRPHWEFLIHDVTAPHVHVARRDSQWRARYAPVAVPGV